MKKKKYVALALVLVLAIGTGAVAKEVFENIKAQIRPDFVIEIDGVEREFKNVDGERVYPILHNGTTYLPIRAIGELMGKTVYWYEDEKRIELREDKAKDKVTVTDADVIIQNGEKDKKDKNAEKPKPDKVGYISEKSAKKIALDKAGLKESEVSFVKVELDMDDGIWRYEVEFKKGFKEYSADIKADDGKILEWDVDLGD